MHKKQTKAAFKQRAANLKLHMKGKCKMNYAKLKESAEDTLRSLDHVDPVKMNKDQFLLYGCSLAIIDHADYAATPKAASLKNTHAASTTYADYVMDELRDAAKYWKDYQNTKKEKFKHIARQELGHAAALLEEVDDKRIATELKERLRNLEKEIT